jgi:YfiH family protein
LDKKKVWDEGNLIIENEGLKYLCFKPFKKYKEELIHCFTTRIGGVSQNEYSSLNLGINKKDSIENVRENYRKICNAINVDINSLVMSKQVHGKNLMKIYEYDDLRDIKEGLSAETFDGFITNKKGITLVTFYADCVPVFFYDSRNKVIALAHSGWRSTVKKIAGEIVSDMVNKFNCSAFNIEVAIGPSIGKCCFEIGEDAYKEFKTEFLNLDKYCDMTGEGKWHVNLQEIIRDTLLEQGILEENIFISGICTQCNKEMFFSYRGDNGKTGSMAAFMQLI